MKKILTVIEKLVSIVFILSGISALSGGERFVDEFTRWGYSMHTLYVFAVLEIIFGLLLLLNKLRVLSLLALLCILIWGLAHHMIYGDSLSLMMPGIVLACAVVLDISYYCKYKTWKQ